MTASMSSIRLYLSLMSVSLPLEMPRTLICPLPQCFLSRLGPKTMAKLKASILLPVDSLFVALARTLSKSFSSTWSVSLLGTGSRQIKSDIISSFLLASLISLNKNGLIRNGYKSLRWEMVGMLNLQSRKTEKN